MGETTQLIVPEYMPFDKIPLAYYIAGNNRCESKPSIFQNSWFLKDPENKKINNNNNSLFIKRIIKTYVSF